MFIVIFLQHSNYNHHPFNLNFIKMKKIVVLIAALFATMGAAQAQMAPVEASPLRFMAGLGASWRGDQEIEEKERKEKYIASRCDSPECNGRQAAYS